MSKLIRSAVVALIAVLAMAGPAFAMPAAPTLAAPATSATIAAAVDPCVWQAAVLSNTTGPATQATHDAASAAVTACQAAAAWLDNAAAAGAITDTQARPCALCPGGSTPEVSNWNATDTAQSLTILLLYLGDAPIPAEAPADTTSWTQTLSTQLGVVAVSYNRLVAYVA